MKQGLLRLTAAFVFVAIASTLTYAQGGGTTAPLSGTVVDSSGAVIPGAHVLVKNEGTGATQQAVTSAQGTFTVPALPPGTYSVTVSLTGFKQSLLKSVKLVAATPTAVKATLEVGGMEDSVVVEGSASMVQTQSAAISTTMEVNQINTLPVASRSALDFITFLPGVSTPGGSRDSTVSGLPQAAINITIDGMSAMDNHLKTGDGFFARLRPGLDAVEEVTVTTAAAGAESSGQGAIQIRFATRSGTNQYHGAAYHTFRHNKLNSNTWFNNRAGLDRARLVQNQPGFRLGGPIIIPGLWNGRDKAFFFVNYEELRQPTDQSRIRTILHPRAQQGVYRYQTGPGAVQEVDLLGLAARNGHIATLDPTIAKLLGDIRSATGTTGTVEDFAADPLLQRYTFQNKQNSHNTFPTVRLDYKLSEKHTLWASYLYNHIDSSPDTLNNRDPLFPGFPVTGSQDSDRVAIQGSLRSTLGANMVNELRFFGASGGATRFTKELEPGMWGGTSVADQGGNYLNMGQACCATALTNASGGGTPSSREGSTRVASNVLNWIRGSHGWGFGAEFTEARVWLRQQMLVPELRFANVSADPASAMFTTANFQGASATNLANAQSLYNILVGRVSEIRGNIRLDEATGKYEYLGAARQRGRLRDFGFFVQDNWRVRPNLTLNLGLRYDLQLPFYSLNDSYSTATLEDVWGVSGVGNLFKPGTLTGKAPQFQQLKKGVRAYDIDFNNFGPSLGFAWRPALNGGLLSAILGNEPVIRGGYSLAYNRPGMSDFTGVFGSNAGIAIDVFRSQTLGNLGTLPVLLRERDRLGAPAFSSTPAYPFSDTRDGDVNIFDRNLQVPYAQTWTLGIQRALGKNMAFEARYVGSRHLQGWGEFNFNEVNIVENGFLNEFRLAQANLGANIAAGRGNTFRYFGPGTGTTPLPIFLAYFNGVPASQAGDASRYTSTQFGNNTFLTPLATFNPQPRTAANALDADSGRITNALNAGLPANFLVANPDLLGGANVTGNSGYTRYDGMELQLRRRMSRGFFFDLNYVFGKAYESSRYSLRTPRKHTVNGGEEGGVVHALKTNWIWDLPFGNGKRFASSAGGALNRIVGGWLVSGTGRLQSGRQLDFGNVRLVGFSEKDLSKMFKLRFDDAGRHVYMLPQDVIDNSVKAFSTSATSTTGYGALGAPSGRYFAPANGPNCIEVAADNDAATNDGFGDCGARSVIVTGPMFWTFDLGIIKRVPLKGRVNFEFRAELLNAANHANFNPVTGVGSNPNSYEVTSATSGRVAQLVARISF